MFRNKEDWMSERAYSLWLAEGRPEGRGQAHWQQAAREFAQLELTRASADGSDLVEKLKAMGRLMRVMDETPPVTAKTTKRAANR